MSSLHTPERKQIIHVQLNMKQNDRKIINLKQLWFYQKLLLNVRRSQIYKKLIAIYYNACVFWKMEGKNRKNNYQNRFSLCKKTLFKSIFTKNTNQSKNSKYYSRENFESQKLKKEKVIIKTGFLYSIKLKTYLLNILTRDTNKAKK